jgi:hypothetical protein
MEKPEQSHIQDKDITVTQNGQWHKTKNQKHQHHGLLLNTVQISMKDSL